MKLALLTFDFPPGVGGVQTYLSQVVRRLAEGRSVTVVTPGSGTPLPGASFSRARPAGDSVMGYRRALRRLDPDRVLVGHAHPRLLLAARLAGRRYGVVAHGDDFLAAQRRWHRPLFNRWLRQADPAIVHSDALRTRLLTRACVEAVTIRPGTDTGVFTPPVRPPPGPPRLLSVARLVPRKGIDTVLRALASIHRAVPEVRYDVVGTGPDRPRLERLAHELGVAEKVAFLGRLPDGELPPAYRRSHVFVMPCREEPAGASLEGFGLVLLEAAASGLPVVAGRSGGAAEAVRDGETGYLVHPHDSEALAGMVRSLLRDPERRREMGRAGRRWVAREMTWDRTAHEIAGALDMLPPP